MQKHDPFVDTSERVNVIKCSADGSVSQENLCEIPGLCVSHSTLSQCGHNMRLHFPYLVCARASFVFNDEKSRYRQHCLFTPAQL